jgi:hypothetical protein
MPVRRWSMALLAILSTGPLLERRKTGGLSPRLGRSGFQPGKSSKEGSVRARANKYCLSWDEPIRGHAACKMASTVAVLRRNWSLRRSAGTDWLWRE